MSEYLAQWRKAEDKFYGAALSAPELYTAGVQLVRGIANHLAEVDTIEGLLAAYPLTTIRQIDEIGETLDLRQRDFLDYNLARDAAFYLRHREILEAQARADMAVRSAEAEQNDQAWVTLYNIEHERQGVTFFNRLEMHLPDGLGIYSAIELDWEKGRVYVVEPMVLDPSTGEPRRDAKPQDPRQEFTKRAEMTAALETLRKKYSSGKD